MLPQCFRNEMNCIVILNTERYDKPSRLHLEGCFNILNCIHGLVKSMEDHKEELILILAGYKNEMNYFLQTNPGLHSRFPIHIDFPDYTQQELLEIAEQMCRKRQYQLSYEAKKQLTQSLQTAQKPFENFGNARTVRNIIEAAIRHQALRLINQSIVTRRDLLVLEPIDLANE